MLRCPVRSLLGLPCPACGASRAFVLLGSRDEEWRHYNTVWVLYAAGVLGAAAMLSLLPARRADVIACAIAGHARAVSEDGRLRLLVITAAALPGWARALQIRGKI